MGHARLKASEDVRIETERFVLRPLQPSDATPRYASWFNDPQVQRYIYAAAAAPSVDELREYIAARQDRTDVLFLGIHTHESDTHIGNVKFEPIDRASSQAVLGIMIGDPAWRGTGAAAEVIARANEWLATHRGIREVILGVARDHVGARRAYEKAGFVVTADDSGRPDAVRMLWRSSAAAA